MQPFFWRRLDDLQVIHRYQSHIGRVQPDPASIPVLFLQTLPPETGNPLAGMFRADGFTEIYAYTVTDISNEAALALFEVIEQLMRMYPEQERLIVVGCGDGGVLGRRYVTLGGYERVAFLFTLGSLHRHSQLAYLRGSIFELRDGMEEPPPVAAPALDKTIQVNVYSELLMNSLDRKGQGVHLPDAVNMALPLGQEALCRDVLTYNALRQYLQGALWVVTVRLHSLYMHGSPDGEKTGPFCFEVNGWRAPFDGVFRVPIDTRFDFDPARTLLGTIIFPLTQLGRAVDIDFRLKDLGPLNGKRRKLFTSLHTPLREASVSEHLLQDSLGSEVGIQVYCDRPDSLINTEL